MSKRLQLLIPDAELAAVREMAEEDGVTVSEWVRRAIRNARRRRASPDVAAKLAALDSAYQHSFPTADIDQMLEEIARGYGPLPE